MISCGAIGADASSTLPPNFGPATVAMDQTTAVAAIATIAVTMMILRISYHPCFVMSCAIVLAHRAPWQREALHTGAEFLLSTPVTHVPGIDPAHSAVPARTRTCDLRIRNPLLLSS